MPRLSEQQIMELDSKKDLRVEIHKATGNLKRDRLFCGKN